MQTRYQMGRARVTRGRTLLHVKQGTAKADLGQQEVKMNAMITIAVAMDLLTGHPLLRGPEVDQALSDYRAVGVGSMPLSDLPRRRRENVVELESLLNSTTGIGPSETQQECRERLASQSPSQLEEAILDLKCSQRPIRRESK